MNRSPFGWDLPPGAAHDPNAPYNQVDPPELVCRGCKTVWAEGKFYDDWLDGLDGENEVGYQMPKTCPDCRQEEPETKP